MLNNQSRMGEDGVITANRLLHMALSSPALGGLLFYFLGMKYRKKPVVIEAEQYKRLPNEVSLEEAEDRIADFINENIEIWGKGKHKQIRINTLDGITFADIGDWIIKGVKGEFYPCKPDIFEMTYEKVEE